MPGFFFGKEPQRPDGTVRPRRLGPAVVLAALLLGGIVAASPVRAQSEVPASTEAERPPALRDPYAIQVNASPDAALIASQLDSLRRNGVPAYRTQTTSGGTTYHRLRIGPFPSRAAAQSFTRCRADSASAWLVPATAERDAFERVVREVRADVVPLRPRPPRFLLGREQSFAALLMPAQGRASATGQPATLRVYAPGRETPVVTRRVTGVRETADGLEYGRAARVFVKDSSETVADYAGAIEAFSRKHGLSQYVVKDGLALYGGGRVARFTLLGSVALPDGTPQTQSQPGFDYVDASGRAVRHQGRIGEAKARQVGNAYDRHLRRDAPTQAATSRVALFARPTERGQNARVCLLFFGGRAPATSGR